ncbi:hypothetical protein SAMN04488505_104244 [Chitinophaga rupis]|uniref:Uncharacterized protein n=1 Tax=Chitinophaga rupis TaxID=573321 RepID=A0A1H7Y072_9BACT|nr:hypothetical protein [Chitinophaga rupis]SEM38737.1 hypothetical protein SAMN04488505_104244 [Chitinophaga rupis]
MLRSVILLVFIPVFLKGQISQLESHSNTDSVVRKFEDLLKIYQDGSMSYKEMPILIMESKNLQKDDITKKITEDYINNYLCKLEEQDLLTRENIENIRKYNQSSRSKLFSFFYNNKDKIDQVMDIKGYAQSYVDYIIAFEEIDPKLIVDNKPIKGEPDWDKMHKTIAHKYNPDYADRNIIEAQLRWYGFMKDTLSLIKYNLKKIDLYGLDTLGFGKDGLNNMIYYMIFRHSSDKVVLNKSVEWMKLLIKGEPDNAAYMDTYANLLYKLGRKQEALAWERKSLSLDPHNRETLFAWEKMKRDEPTWPSKKDLSDN